jgi:hypothetical protein
VSRYDLLRERGSPLFQIGSNVEVEFQVEAQRHAAIVLACDAQRATLETKFKPPVGAVIQIGRVGARVAAHLPTAIVVEFLNIQE